MVDREISRARTEVIAELARAVSRMRSAKVESEWYDAVLESGRLFANEPAAIDLIASLAALTTPASVASEPARSALEDAAVEAPRRADSNGTSVASRVAEPDPAGESGPTGLGEAGPAAARIPDSTDAHAAAVRFARVKIAELQLYHASEVKAGRASHNLYESLKPHIDDARKEFRERFLAHSNPAADANETNVSNTAGSSETSDYLHAEMLHALAHDDATLLGPNYPGPLA